MSRRSGRICPPRQVRDVPALEDDRARRSARAAGSAAGRWWSCRSRTRRPGRASRPRWTSKSMPVDGLHRADLAAEEQALGDREVLLQPGRPRAAAPPLRRCRTVAAGGFADVGGSPTAARAPSAAGQLRRDLGSQIRRRVSAGRWQATRWPPVPISQQLGHLGRGLRRRCSSAYAAARVERAAGRQVDQARRGALDRDQPRRRRPVQPRHRAEQPPGVRVLGPAEDVLGRAVLDALGRRTSPGCRRPARRPRRGRG